MCFASVLGPILLIHAIVITKINPQHIIAAIITIVITTVLCGYEAHRYQVFHVNFSCNSPNNLWHRHNYCHFPREETEAQEKSSPKVIQLRSSRKRTPTKAYPSPETICLFHMPWNGYKCKKENVKCST